MRRATQKEIKQDSWSQDITSWTCKEVEKLMRDAKHIHRVAYSAGMYGINGIVVNIDGYSYKSVGRVSATFVLAG